MLLVVIIGWTDANNSNRDTDGETVTIPALIGEDLWTKYDWNFSTTAQTFLDKGKRAFNSGCVVGGSSILNGFVWTRGAKPDYDAWEALGNPGWGWKDLLPYFERVSHIQCSISSAHLLTEMSERNIHS
jgi:choline dehydrogenase-like flavoprotein